MRCCTLKCEVSFGAHSPTGIGACSAIYDQDPIHPNPSRLEFRHVPQYRIIYCASGTMTFRREDNDVVNLSDVYISSGVLPKIKYGNTSTSKCGMPYP